MIIRWVSEDGKRKWIYPVEKDLYSKGRIIKQVSTKAKVIGITKVNIPSPLHPIIPYYVMLLEDKYGNRMPKKTMRECKIGDTYEVKAATTDNAVIITKIKYDVEEYLKESLKLVHAHELEAADKILIKPSIIEAAYAYQAVNTNPKVIDGLISYLREKGIEDIAVGEQAMLGNDVIDAANKAGILDVCKKHNVPFIDLSKAEYAEKTSDGFSFRIAKDAMDRKVINAPVVKTNSQIGISGAMENMIRVTDERTQKKMFEEDIEKSLPKLIKALPEFLTVGDATIGLHAQGPTSLGEPAFLNMLFISKNPVALDSVFAEAGLFKMPQYLKEAAAIGLGSNNARDIEIVGDELEAIKQHLKYPEKDVTSHPHIKLIDGKADPYIFNSALKMTAKLVGLLGYEMWVAIGLHFSEEELAGKNRLVAYGKDAIKRTRELGAKTIAEIPDDIDDMEKIVLLKSVLENKEKRNITAADKLKSKITSIGAKIKGSF
ncbi:DUF362 domain-containing protein [Candidatus Woesearchaeota archaeon]|nr:DUF362 domain-containing protein [Candidatus Woesearchaeota archaeon]